MLMPQSPQTTSNPALPAAESPELSRRWGPEQRRWLAFWLAYFILWNAAWFGASLLGAFGNAVSVWYPPAGLRFFVLLTFGWRAFPPV